ncbi:MAG: DUF2029 domain-containing protein, partial [Actinobacteria bacterium]|nr:DUF2029 domain-containing protein [Actinomycetota bacterium]
AMPQYVAELAILVGIFGCARRLGFGLRGAACSALLFATFSSVALEATTAQNDLVAAAFALVAAYFLLSSRATEFALAGAAVGVGVGVKLTVALVLPVLALLALRRGPRRFGTFAAGAAAGFALIGMWGYVLNVIHTGHVLGHGGGRVEWQSSPAWPSTFVTALHLAYRMFDLSAVSYRLAYILAGAGAGVALLVIALRRVSWREEALVGLPFLAPALMVAGADAVAGIAHGFGYSFYDAVFGSGPNHSANEDTSAFGPLGAMVVLGAPAAAVVRTDGRRRLLAVAPIVFVLLLVLDSKYNPWLTRFLLVPGALATPLAAGVLRRRWLAWGTLVVAAIVVGLTLTHDRRKPLESPHGPPWELTRSTAMKPQGKDVLSGVVADYDRAVPAHACVGAVLGPTDPSYVLFGRNLDHRVFFFAGDEHFVIKTRLLHLFYVVVSRRVPTTAADELAAAGWTRHLIGPWWWVFRLPEPGAVTGDCA